MKDVDCPYCGRWMDVCHDDGFVEDNVYEQKCPNCGKRFALTASLSWDFYSRKAECMNGEEHEFGDRRNVGHVRGYTDVPYEQRDCTACGAREQRQVREV